MPVVVVVVVVVITHRRIVTGTNLQAVVMNPYQVEKTVERQLNRFVKIRTRASCTAWRVRNLSLHRTTIPIVNYENVV